MKKQFSLRETIDARRTTRIFSTFFPTFGIVHFFSNSVIFQTVCAPIYHAHAHIYYSRGYSVLLAAFPRETEIKGACFKANRSDKRSQKNKKKREERDMIQTRAGTYSLLSTRNDLGDMQLTLHSVFPCSLHIVMENLP